MARAFRGFLWNVAGQTRDVRDIRSRHYGLHFAHAGVAGNRTAGNGPNTHLMYVPGSLNFGWKTRSNSAFLSLDGLCEMVLLEWASDPPLRNQISVSCHAARGAL